MKQRFSSLDIKVIAHELSNRVCTLRLANVYDLSSRIFLLKFAKPDKKESFVVDSGFRCHLTSFTRTTAAAPSAFVLRLRKFLRSRRLTSVSQVGTDRILEFQFSEGQYRLFLEFYASGNIILTDKDLSIIALLRIVSAGSNQEELRVGLKYSITDRQNFGGIPALTEERIRNALEAHSAPTATNDAAPPKKSKKRPGDVIKKALAQSFHEFPPALIEHVLQTAELSLPGTVEELLADEARLKELFHALHSAKKISGNLTANDTCQGFIAARIKAASDHSKQGRKEDGSDSDLIYEDFQPFYPQQFRGDPSFKVLEFPVFNSMVDEFFSSVESQKLESRITEREYHAKRKLEAAKQDHEKRLGGLQQVQELNVHRAQAIEANLDRVQEAISAVNSLVAQGIGWPEIARMIEMEQQRQNPVALIIQLPLKLYENTITLLLSEGTYEDEPDFEGEETDSEVSDSEEDESEIQSKPKAKGKSVDKKLAIDVDLALSPWSNARQFYDQKKSAAVKEVRTLQASARALKNTEAKIHADLKRELNQEKELMRPQRTPFWFEKFLYFISSEGYLVLGGKDIPQNEILYNKHLKKGDVFVHADLPGASTIVIKNRRGKSSDPIPPSTLSQAGNLAVCTSSAWDSKAVMSAWWTPAEQISKTSPNGEYLQTGVFHVRGTKNFLPPAQLLLGFGIMFKISDQSKAKHLKHRVAEDQTLEGNPSNGTAIEVILESTEGTLEKEPALQESSNGGSQNTVEIEPVPADSDADSQEASNRSDDESDPEDSAPNPLLSNGHPERPHGSNSISENDEDSRNVTADTARLAEEDDSRSILTLDEDGVSRVKHLSAKERQKLKQGQSITNLETESKMGAASDTKDLSAATQEEIANKSRQVRGKQGKRNKIKTKYADQDEEDRALAMRLLGSAAAQEKAKEDAATKANKEEELAAAKARRRKQHEMAAEKGKQAEALRRLNFEGVNNEADEDDTEQQQVDLDGFVGEALPGDEILDAIIVCGPWDAVGRKCKWRVKIQPGAVKKGKAVKEILSSWASNLNDRDKKPRPTEAGDEAALAEQNVRNREAELIRAFRDTEVVGLVPVGKMRLVMGGGAGADNKGKGKGKGNAVGGNQSKRGGKGNKRR